MNIALQIVLGVFLGVCFGIVALISQIKATEKNLLKIWIDLSKTLNVRYSNLRNLLAVIKRYMTDYQKEIEEFDDCLDKAINVKESLSNVSLKLSYENEVNFKFENIKRYMDNSPSLYEDTQVAEAMSILSDNLESLINSIDFYNLVVNKFRVLLNTFPYSFSAKLINKTSEKYMDFFITPIDQFGADYVDEDEINV